MKIIKRIARAVKNEIRLYLIFRKLDHSQIESMRRQAELVQAAKRRDRQSKVEYQLERGPLGLDVLAEVA